MRIPRPVDASSVPSRLPSYAALLLLFAVGSCTATGGSGGTSRGGSGEITQADIEGTSALTAHDAVDQLRPAWLRARGARTIENPNPYATVYVDGLRRGELDELRGIPVTDVDTIDYLSPSDATTRFGLGHTGGVIRVTTLR